MTLMCIERAQSPTHKGNFLQGGKSAVSNINQQNANNNHRRNNSCSPPLSKSACTQQQPHDIPANKSNANSESRKLERSCSSSDADRRGAVQSNSSRYKTELCRPFEENGSCKYGDKCQFAHGKKELRNMIRHPKYKTELCRTFHTTGLCPYGPRCHFIHNSEQNKKSLLTTLTTAPTAGLRQDEGPRSSLGSDGEVSPPSSHGGSPTETKSFDDIFQQPTPMSPCYNNQGFFNQDLLNIQRYIDFGSTFDYKNDFYDSVNGFNDKYGSNNNNYQNGTVLDLHPVGPLTPTSPLETNGVFLRLPIFDAFQKV
ncbi:mRNA decay activator protein ZFP36L1 [Caerostris darwini]|uniref:mRNA decay activator protein ZFP36L1 n=1 Tax=Caerostris darwini TaxID=1538125 RepID=A0AAV4MSN3_9ARAC|nr:mRNA decay activator protein ZFP36L1 [Caerostris darwini]